MNDLPFGEEVFAEIRKNVMARVTRPRRFVAVWAVAATAAAIALVILVTPTHRRAGLRPAAVASPARPLPVQSARAGGPSTAGGDARAPQRKHHHHAQPAVIEPVRIELTTNDPDVRIIWITDRRNHEETGNDVPGTAAGDGRRGR